MYYNPNRSALLCKLMSDYSLLAVNLVSYFTMIIAMADLFKGDSNPEDYRVLDERS